MTTQKIPYPARRKYTWAYPNEVHSYEQARNLFARMRRQAPEDDNPSRFKALTMALEALAHLSHHQGVDIFPGPKLHKLLCKSALAADWCPDLGAKQRAACAQPVSADDVEGGDSSQPLHSLYRCPKCREIKPLAEFLKPVSAAQRKLWGWTNAHSTRTTKAKMCRDCRHKAQQRSARQSDRIEAKKAIRAYESAISNGTLNTRSTAQHHTPEVVALVYDYWQALINKVLSATRASRHTAALTPHAPTLEFYDIKLELVARVKERFETAAEAGQLAPYIVPSPHWTLFLDENELLDIQLAHTRMTTTRRDENIRGRVPAI